jgi:acyl carrier protein
MPSVQELIAKIEHEIEELPQGALQPDTNFRQLPEWSSMHALIIIALAETEYNVTLSGNDLRSCVTIADLHSIIESRMN